MTRSGLYVLCLIVGITTSGCAGRSFHDKDHICTEVLRIERKALSNRDRYFSISEEELHLLSQYGSYSKSS